MRFTLLILITFIKYFQEKKYKFHLLFLGSRFNNPMFSPFWLPLNAIYVCRVHDIGGYWFWWAGGQQVVSGSNHVGSNSKSDNISNSHKVSFRRSIFAPSGCRWLIDYRWVTLAPVKHLFVSNVLKSKRNTNVKL